MRVQFAYFTCLEEKSQGKGFSNGALSKDQADQKTEVGLHTGWASLRCSLATWWLPKIPSGLLSTSSTPSLGAHLFLGGVPRAPHCPHDLNLLIGTVTALVTAVGRRDTLATLIGQNT